MNFSTESSEWRRQYNNLLAEIGRPTMPRHASSAPIRSDSKCYQCIHLFVVTLMNQYREEQHVSRCMQLESLSIAAPSYVTACTQYIELEEDRTIASAVEPEDEDEEDDEDEEEDEDEYREEQY